MRGARVPVTTIEYDILEFLVRAAGRVVSRDELSAVLYQRAASPFDRSLDVHVSHLRKKLGEHGSLIRTVRGVGYLFRGGPRGTRRRDMRSIFAKVVLWFLATVVLSLSAFVATSVLVSMRSSHRGGFGPDVFAMQMDDARLAFEEGGPAGSTPTCAGSTATSATSTT